MNTKNMPYKKETGEGFVNRVIPPVVPTAQTPQTAVKRKSLWEQIPAWGYVVLVLAVVIIAVAAGAIIVAH